MFYRSGMFAVNTTVGTEIAVNEAYAPITVIRRYGTSCQLCDKGILLNDIGYYDINVIANVRAKSIGEVTASIQQDNVIVAGSSTTVSVNRAGDIIAIPINTKIRLTNNEISSIISVVITGQAVDSFNLTINVNKVN